MTSQLALIISLTFLPAGADPAQEQEKTAAKAQPVEPTAEVKLRTRIFQLRYADASQVAATLQNLCKKGQTELLFVPHEPTNSVLVMAPPESQESIEDLIKKLDVEPAERPGTAQSVLQILRLKNRKVDQELEHLLLSIRPDSVSLALDPRTNVVIASGDQKSVLALRSLLEAMDQSVEPEEKPSKVRHARIVWLVAAGDDPAFAGLPPPPDDLKEVLDELAKVSIKDLRNASSPQITAMVGQPFSLEVSPDLGEEGCDLTIKGTFAEAKGSLTKLTLEIAAKLVASPPRNQKLCSLSTVVLAPSGHPVVLCVSPIGKITSVFVIQVSGAD